MKPTFRDPDGTCWMENGRVVRYVFPLARDEFLKFHHSGLSRSLQGKGLLPATRELALDEIERLDHRPDAGKSGGIYLEHERIGFPSFAHEWSAGMLFAAGMATLEVQREALAAGFTLKDATPANILFRGSRCVMVDYLSMVAVRPDDYLWIAEGQFIRNFLLPLLVYKITGEAPHLAAWAKRDGLEPADVYRKIGWRQRLSPKALRFVSAPTWLAGSQKAKFSKAPSGQADPKRNAFLRLALHESLRKAFVGLNPGRSSRSRWSEYMSEHNYDPVAFSAKENFVRTALAEVSPRRLLDVGCNTGHFSRMAAEAGAEVVAVDYDALSVDHVFEASRTHQLDILPLTVNLAWPSPSLGWEHSERPSFLSRAENYFECALLLAVVHHLAVTDGIPFRRIFSLLAKLVTRSAVVEYVSPEDSMMQGLLFNKEHLLPVVSQEAFEASLAPWFSIARRQPLSEGRRCLYLLHRTSAASA